MTARLSRVSALLLLTGCSESVDPEIESFLVEHRHPSTWETLDDQLVEGLPRRIRDPRTGIDFVLVPPGEFEMGRNAPGEHPVHMVRITKPFYMGRTEVTTGQWRKWIVEHGGEADLPADDAPADHPATFLSWEQARTFCSRYGYDLPTEAQWEYACRGNAVEGEQFWEDQDTLGQHAWSGSNSGGDTHPVATREPNNLGLHDMLGNVWEWCASWYANGYQVDPSRITEDPAGPPVGVDRVLRGGSWFTAPAPRPSDRGGDKPDVKNAFYGFRVIVTW